MSKFKRAIHEALTAEYESYIPQITEGHVFSEKFNRKIRKLISRRKKPYYKLINTAWKRTACFIAVIIVSFVMMVQAEAVRNIFKDFVSYIYEKFSVFQVVDNGVSAPETIEDIYEITYDLSDFEIDYEEHDAYSRNITYKNGDVIIDFYQITKMEYNLLWNTEEADVETIIIDNKESLYFIDNHKFKHIIWDNGNYIISISSNIDKSKLVDIAKSVQKIEK